MKSESLEVVRERERERELYFNEISVLAEGKNAFISDEIRNRLV